MKAHLVLAWTLGWTLLSRTIAFAGSNASDTRAVDEYGAEAVVELARLVHTQLDARRINVAIVAHRGRDPDELPDGVSWTHAGVAVFEAVQSPGGAVGHTYTIYQLYQGHEGRADRSYLAQNFVIHLAAHADDLEIAVAVPTEPLQRRIVEVIRSPGLGQLYAPRYSLIADPYTPETDNCISFLVKVVIAAIYDTRDVERIYRIIGEYYLAQEVRLGLFQRVGGRLAKGIDLGEHDASPIRTATFTSLVEFLDQYGLLEDYFVVRHMPD